MKYKLYEFLRLDFPAQAPKDVYQFIASMKVVDKFKVIGKVHKQEVTTMQAYFIKHIRMNKSGMSSIKKNDHECEKMWNVIFDDPKTPYSISTKKVISKQEHQ